MSNKITTTRDSSRTVVFLLTLRKLRKRRLVHVEVRLEVLIGEVLAEFLFVEINEINNIIKILLFELLLG